MSNYDDGSFDVYICPVCQEEYDDFRDMMICYKSCSVGGKEDE